MRFQRSLIESFVILITLAFSFIFYCYFLKMDIAESKSRDFKSSVDDLMSLRIPNGISFAGEKVPQNDFSIKSTLEGLIGKSGFERSAMGILISRARKWFPVIEKILKKNGIPDDFKFLALAESRLTNSYSPRSAAGFWQFIPSTAINYGLEVDSSIDERLDVFKSTEAACRFLMEARKRLGNWTLAAAAFNAGIGGLEQARERQPKKNYYNLLINKETGLYIYRALALKTLFHGVDLKSLGSYYNVGDCCSKLIAIKSDIEDLSTFIAGLGFEMSQVRQCNPWLIGNQLIRKDGKKYWIRLPCAPPSIPMKENFPDTPQTKIQSNMRPHFIKMELALGLSRKHVERINLYYLSKEIIEKSDYGQF